ncbi:flagellar hook-basal body complex protein FliE [Actinoplanes sp. NBRC 103695]|nr:flagellar hook-basal body complex protein FliE [Actinoplanes sp. NBRC 103695]
MAKTSGTEATAPTGTAGTDFAGMLSSGLESVQAAQTKASDLAVQVANGTLADPAQYTMASTEAALGLQLTMAVRNKALEAFQEIMRMQA